MIAARCLDCNRSPRNFLNLHIKCIGGVCADLCAAWLFNTSTVFQLGWAGCKRNWAQSSARTTKIRAQFSAQTTQNLLRVNDQNLVLWAIDENMGTNLQAFYKHFYIGCLKTQKQQLHFIKIKIKQFLIFFFHLSGQDARTSSRAQASTGRAQRHHK